jgi:hypothetical protein
MERIKDRHPACPFLLPYSCLLLVTQQTVSQHIVPSPGTVCNRECIDFTCQMPYTGIDLRRKCELESVMNVDLEVSINDSQNTAIP